MMVAGVHNTGRLSGYLCMNLPGTLIGRKAGRGAQLWSRNQKSLSRRFPSVVKTLAGLPDDTIIDGEVVALDQHGRPSFDLLQGLGKREPLIVLYAFDEMMLQGRDVRTWPLEERRGELREAIKGLPDKIPYSARSMFRSPRSNTRLENTSSKASWPSAPAARTVQASAAATG